MPLRRLGEPFFQRLGVLKNLRVAAPARNGLHLRMGGDADDDGGLPLPVGLLHNGVDAPDIGTGGVLNHRPTGSEALIDRPGHPVAADHHLRSRLRLLPAVDLVDAHGGEPLHHMVVVDDGAVGNGGNAAFGRRLHHIHRPLDPGAEPGGLCNLNLHRPSPRS